VSPENGHSILLTWSFFKNYSCLDVRVHHGYTPGRSLMHRTRTLRNRTLRGYGYKPYRTKPWVSRFFGILHRLKYLNYIYTCSHSRTPLNLFLSCAIHILAVSCSCRCAHRSSIFITRLWFGFLSAIARKMTPEATCISQVSHSYLPDELYCSRVLKPTDSGCR
jgi:hypothetical protein